MNKTPSIDEAISLLKKAGCNKEVLAHAIKVSELAKRIAEACMDNGVDLDLKLVEVGALLHDIGRAYTHDVHHGVKGAQILRSLGFPERIVRIAESHVGAGIPKEEAKNIGLPIKNYTPQSIEEKIICYADKLISGNKVMSFKQALEDMRQCLGAGHPALKRLVKLREDILKLTGGKDFAGSFDGKDSKKEMRREFEHNTR